MVAASRHSPTLAALELADRYGFAVLAPEQTWSNNAYRSFNWFENFDSARGRGEAASISQMVSFAKAEFDIDAERVFVTGLSSGGAMTAVMLATYPEVFAGGAVLAGLPYGSAENAWEALRFMSREHPRSGTEWGDKVRGASSSIGPWPCVSIWHGENDATVRPSAGEDLVSQWTNVHGVHGRAAYAKTGDGRNYRVWHSSTGAALVEHHSIAHMGHGTPIKTGGTAGCGQEGPYLLEHGISSSLEIATTWGIAKITHTQ
jgi:feruloyl esterase